MKRGKAVTFKYLGIGFACLVVSTVTLRVVGALDLAPITAGAILLSLFVASGEEETNKT